MPPDYTYTEIEGANENIGEVAFMPSTLETIDYAFYDFVNEKGYTY